MRAEIKKGMLIVIPESDADRVALGAWRSEQAGHVFYLSGKGRDGVLHDPGPRDEACNEPIRADWGEGVPRDRDEAIQWFRRAAAAGNEEGARNIRRLEESSPPVASGGSRYMTGAMNSQQQYIQNRMHGPLNDCHRPGGGGGAGC
jgi:hypothetical protein